MSWQQVLEERQTGFYFGAVMGGLLLGWLLPSSRWLMPLVEPVIAAMMLATFLQLPLASLGRMRVDLRFASALIFANFVLVPLLVLGLSFSPWWPDLPLWQVAVLLVLLAPCIDYVVPFAHLGQADASRLLAATPMLLLLQMLLLPLLIRGFLGETGYHQLPWQPFLLAFLMLIVLPLLLALGAQYWARRSPQGASFLRAAAAWPVPLTALVLLVVTAATTPWLREAMPVAKAVVPLYVLYALLAPVLGWVVGRVFRLPGFAARAVAFSSGTRNSLIILPLGLSIPGAMPWVPAIIVTQTLVELLAELLYVRMIASWGQRQPSA